MKFLIAFALFAVACADVEPFRLRDAPAPTIEGSVVYPYLINVVQSPIPVDALESSAAVSSTANIVKVADFVKGEFSIIGGVKAIFTDAEPSYDRTVKFVDEAVNEEHVDNDSLLVKVVEGPLEEASPSDLTVNVVDEAVNDINDNGSIVNVVDEAVNDINDNGSIVNVVDEAVNDINDNGSVVNVVDEAVNDINDNGSIVNVVDEAVNDINDNGSIVKVVESLVEEVALSDIAVNFVNKAVNKMASQKEIAPSFDSYAGISKLIENAQQEKYEGSSTVVVVVSPEVLNIPTTVNVVENAVNMGHILAVGMEESYEDSVDVHAKAEAYDDGILEKVKVAEFSRGKVFDNPMLR